MIIKKEKCGLRTICLIGALIFIISGTLLACGNNVNVTNDSIKAIVVSFGGDPIGSYSYKITEEENIIEAMRIYEKLKQYKSPKVSTWFEDVTYEIERKDGRIEKTTFKKVRPVTDIFEKTFQSLEVREQRESVLATDISEIAKVEIYSAKTGETIVYENRNDIEALMLSLKEYYRGDEIIKEHKYTIIEVELFNIEDEYIGGGLIYRNDKQTQSVLDNRGDLNNVIVNPSDIDFMILTQGESKIELSDINMIQIVLDNYQGYHMSESIVTVEYHLKETKGMRLDWHGSFLRNAVPKEIESLFK